MAKELFWGEKGEYGPFPVQEDGWPCAGAVVRYYRRKKHMSAQTLAQRYSEATQTTITARWIYKMEQENKIPTDITRRRVLAEILDIPLVLFGLTPLESVTYRFAAQKQEPNQAIFHEKPDGTKDSPAVLSYASLDLERQEKEAQTFWKLHYAQTAQDALPEILTTIKTLAPVQQTAKGDLKRYLSKLINSYYRLGATIQRDRGNFQAAYILANEGVRVAKEISGDVYGPQIVAASQYTRGVVNFAWGAFGDQVKQGAIVQRQEKIEAALIDFERASRHASLQLRGIIYSEMARARALLPSSPSEITLALRLLEQAEPFVGKEEHKGDFSTQILLDADFKGLDKKRLILSRAKTFLAIGRPARAREEFTDLELMRNGSLHTRRRVWMDVFSAQADIEVGDYLTATEKLTGAFGDCIEVHSLTHLARIRELHKILSLSPYKDKAQVKYLGRLLQKEFSQRV